jgi:hypothetical protein
MSTREARQEDRRSSVRRRAEEHSSGFGKASFRKPDGWTVWAPKKAGIARLDLFNYRVGKGNPYADEGSLHPERTFFVHRGVGADGNDYICNRLVYKEPCSICDWTRDHSRDPQLSEVVAKYTPKERQLFILKDLEDAADKFQLFEYSFHLFGKQLDAAIKLSDEDEGHDNYGSYKAGRTLKVSWIQRGFEGATFYEADAVSFKVRPAYDKALLADMPCLDDLLQKFEYDALKDIFLQLDPTTQGKKKPAASDDDDDDDKPAPKKKPAAAAADDDDDDDMPPPKKKPAAKPAPADDDDDDADDAPPPKKKPKPAPVEDADDDDDDAPPPKKKPKAVAAEDDDDDDAPAPKKKAAAKEESWDEDWDDTPPKKPAKK